MMYLFGLGVSSAIGYYSLKHLVTGKKINGALLFCMSMALGLGLCGAITFFSHLLFEWHNPWSTILPSAGLLGFFIYLCRQDKFSDGISLKEIYPSLILLSAIGIFLVLEANYYPLGGWDAWSCWNLKAKFIFLGGENWKDMFEPILWRSNTHYPLSLPCINVWFWNLIGQDDPRVPMYNSILFTLLSAGVLLFALTQACIKKTLSLIITAAVFFIPFNITLSISQYSDILLGLFLICAFVAYLSDELLLAAVFLGLLSFTKTEGTVAAVLLTLLIWLKNQKSYGRFLTTFILSSLPTIIFTLMMAPRNEAFINGLTSTLKPSTMERLQLVLNYPIVEFLSGKWNGIWILLFISLGLFWKKAFTPKLQIFALFFLGYLSVLLGYYQLNTFFEIRWWMDNTLNRFIFAILPSFALWAGLSMKDA